MLLLVTWIVVFALVTLPIAAVHVWLLQRGEADERVLIAAPFVAGGVLAGVVFAAFFVDPAAGELAAISSAVASGAYLVWQRQKVKSAIRSAPLTTPLVLGFAVGLFYLGLLYLPQFGREPEFQANIRFLYEFPMDATLPKLLGDRLYAGESPRPFLPEAGWLSSDRPPLQSGFYLLVRPWLDLFQLPVGLGYQCVGTIVQLFCLPALWLIGRRLNLGSRIAVLILMWVAASGFLLFNSTYVWPKLLAGGYVVLAAVLLLDRIDPRTRVTAGLGGGAAALGWLSHGGVAFSLIALPPILLIPLWNPGRKKLFVSLVVFAVLCLPWTAYQKFYDPPGNRLLKWHLAGVVPIDSRSTLAAVRDAYGGMSRDALIDSKLANIHTLGFGTHRDALNPFTTPLQKRRVDEFFYVFRSLGILNLAWVFAPLTWWMRRRFPPLFELQGVLGLWAAGTLAVWCVLMYLPGSTLLHQGSYAAMLVLFFLAIVFLVQIPWWLGIPVLAWHTLSFALTWLPYYKSAPIDPGMFFLMGLAVAIVFLWCRKINDDHEPDPTESA